MDKTPLRARFNNAWIVEFNTTLQGYTFLGVWISDRLHIFFNDIHILAMPYGTPYSEVVTAIYTLVNRYDNTQISKRAIVKALVPHGSINDVLATSNEGE